MRTSSINRFLTAVISTLICVSLSACHSGKKITSEKYPNSKIEQIQVGKSSKRQKMIIEEAETWLGTPYQYAHAEKGEGTDCSGMVMSVYESVTGVKLPRNSAKQAEFCEEIDADRVETADLIFFATGKNPDRISHVGIVIDNERFIHASSSKGVVISNFTTPYYQKTFRQFGRVPLK
jgi:cell wall-associated NlpC family hydrolase